MKFTTIKNRFSLVQILLVCAIIGLLAALTLPARAQLNSAVTAPPYQTGQPNFFNLDTNSTSFALTNNQTQTFTAGGTNTYIKTIRQNQGLSLFLAVWQTNSVPSTTTNYSVAFDVTGDGATWTRGLGAHPFIWTVSLAGAGPSTNVFWTNLPPALLSNLRKMQATQTSTTASNSVFGALGYSQSTQ